MFSSYKILKNEDIIAPLALIFFRKKSYMIKDMLGRSLEINDRVQFVIDLQRYEGVVNLISTKDMIRINSLAEEYMRKSSNVLKLNNK